MKPDIILAKNWIQTPKEGYDNRFDEFLTFFLEGGRVYNFVFFWVRSVLSKILLFEQKINEMGRRKAPRAHI